VTFGCFARQATRSIPVVIALVFDTSTPQIISFGYGPANLVLLERILNLLGQRPLNQFAHVLFGHAPFRAICINTAERLRSLGAVSLR
jgi:hypothetical protein